MKLITTSCIKQLAVLMLCSTIGEAFSSSGARMGDKDLDAALWRDRESTAAACRGRGEDRRGPLFPIKSAVSQQAGQGPGSAISGR